jgi:L-threonylcarbamoyladenylate synthase
MFKTEILDLVSLVDCEKAAKLLLDGHLVAIPTETVYGLAADAKNKSAIAKIFEVKKRPNNHPLIVHIAGACELELWAVDIPKIAYTLAKAFWPGPLTMVLNKAHDVLEEISGGLQTIALRVPSKPRLLEMMRRHHLGLVAPSANLHKKLSPTEAKHVYKGLQGLIPAVLDGGSCSLGLESTIIDLTQDKPTILRQGPVSKKDLEDILQIEVMAPQIHSVAAPGNMHIHYQPCTKSYLIASDGFEQKIQDKHQQNVGFLYYGDFASLTNSPSAIKLAKNAEAYASLLYSSLHQLDSLQLKAIYIQEPPCSLDWEAVKDRLRKATN